MKKKSTISSFLLPYKGHNGEFEIVSNDRLKLITQGQLDMVYNIINPLEKPQHVYFSSYMNSSIISFSSKSLIIAVNDKQVCKISFLKKREQEINNHKVASMKSDLFPKFINQIDFPNGWKGILMERIENYNRLNFSAKELHDMQEAFVSEIKRLHNIGIIHNDLGYAKGTQIRPNIILSRNRIRLIDCEKMIINASKKNSKELEEEEKNISVFSSSLSVGYGFGFLT